MPRFADMDWNVVRDSDERSWESLAERRERFRIAFVMIGSGLLDGRGAGDVDRRDEEERSTLNAQLSTQKRIAPDGATVNGTSTTEVTR